MKLKYIEHASMSIRLQKNLVEGWQHRVFPLTAKKEVAL